MLNFVLVFFLFLTSPRNFPSFILFNVSLQSKEARLVKPDTRHEYAQLRFLWAGQTKQYLAFCIENQSDGTILLLSILENHLD